MIAIYSAALSAYAGRAIERATLSAFTTLVALKSLNTIMTFGVIARLFLILMAMAYEIRLVIEATIGTKILRCIILWRNTKNI